MIKIRYLLFASLILSLSSCSVETMNTRQMFDGQNPNALLTGRLVYESGFSVINSKLQRVKYTADLTNILNQFPNLQSNEVNAEVARMKVSIQNYIYAVKNSDKKKEQRYYDSYVKSFQRLQKLKKKLNSDEATLLESYLMRIKANINSIEYLS